MASITKVKNKDGVWVYRLRYVVGYRPNGDPIQRMQTFRTMTEAKAAGKAAETDRDRGIVVEPAKVRTSEFLGQWLERAARRVRPSTMHGYRYVVERYILLQLGPLRLRELTPATLQAWIDQLPTADIAHRSRRTLHVALEEAVRLGLLATNAADRVTTPPRPASTATSWSKQEARTFLAAAASQIYHPYWLLAVRMALRPSELLGLRWSAVDLDAGTLTVTEGRATVANASYPGGPKSESGYRTLDLPPDVVQALRTHKARQNARRLACGPSWRDGELVCTAEVGQPIAYRNLARGFKQLCSKAGVKKIRLYDLRHTAISLMAEAGADLKAISEVAGHANVQITRSVYQHINRGQRAAALAALGEALSEPEPPLQEAAQ